MSIDRIARACALGIAAAATLAASVVASAQAPAATQATLYKNPDCGC